MRKNFFLFLILALIFSSHLSLRAADFQIFHGDWNLHFKEKSKALDFFFKGKTILVNVVPLAKYNLKGGKECQLRSDSFPSVEILQEPLQDAFGKGTKYTFRYSKSGLPTLRHIFYAYENLPYFLTELSLDSDQTLYSNYLSPITTTTGVSFLDKSVHNRMLMVPWDNDAWVRYESNTLTKSMLSYEATAVYNGEKRSGLVVGSIDHDTWKSGIQLAGKENHSVDSLVCFSGASSTLTRDVLPHGKVKGKTVCSARFFVGFFEDWRNGMEVYGRANTKVASSRTWNKGAPFGWNSWGVMAEKVTHAGVTSVSDFFKTELYDKGFHNDSNVVIIDLDSFWDNMTESQLQQFAGRCKSQGQIPGIYWGPFSDWGNDGERFVEGTDRQYKYKDCYLYVHGGVHSQGGRCLDPTHPATKARMKYQIGKFKEWGYSYIKLDFITNGAVQGDSYYNPNVSTGTQAYNEGFQYLTEIAGKEVFLSLSIAPLFPFQYGNSRRMCCDSWANIENSQYVMNALSFGWWTNEFYQFNDPDHIVLLKDGNESKGVNRARVTTGAISGMFLFGDNFSTVGPDVGFPTLSRERALEMMTNPDINEIARLGRSFKPVDGFTATNNGADPFFVYETEQYVYLAALNYGAATISGTLPWERIGLKVRNIDLIKELWMQTDVKKTAGGFSYQVPPSDARIYRISKNGFRRLKSNLK